MTRHWMRLNAQEGRQKKKTLVDTKASKGRKIRYDIHPKMVGFGVKRDQGSWSHQQRNQLFRGVFQSWAIHSRFEGILIDLNFRPF